MLDFSGSAFTDESFGENGEGFECLSWFFSSSAPSSVAIVKSSFLNYNVCGAWGCVGVFLFCFVFVIRLLTLLFFFKVHYLLPLTIFLSSNYHGLLSPKSMTFFPKCLFILKAALLKTATFVPMNFSSPMFWLLLPVLLCQFSDHISAIPTKVWVISSWTWIFDVTGFYQH